MRWQPNKVSRGGFTLAELTVALGVAIVLMAGLVSGLVTVKKSMEATDHYILETNNASRAVDYVSRDLHRAVRVGSLVAGVNTPLKTTSFSVTETNTLTMNIPDYYKSNSPDNRERSGFKTGRNARTTLDPNGYSYSAAPSASGSVTWSDAVMTIGSVQVARYAPAAAASDEIQVRYTRGPRSAQDGTVCYFRQEFTAAGASLSNRVEVAEQVIYDGSTTALIVTGLNGGALFRIQSNFTPRFRFTGAPSAGTNQMLEVPVLNVRRD